MTDTEAAVAKYWDKLSRDKRLTLLLHVGLASGLCTNTFYEISPVAQGVLIRLLTDLSGDSAINVKPG